MNTLNIYLTFLFVALSSLGTAETNPSDSILAVPDSVNSEVNIEPASEQEVTEDYYSLENIRKFADYLFLQQDFIRAAGEYDRASFLANEYPEKDSALFLAGLSFLYGNEFEKARRRFEGILTYMRDRDLVSKSEYNIGRILYYEGKFLDAEDFLKEQHYQRGQRIILPIRKTEHLRALIFARLGHWDEAVRISCDSGHLDNYYYSPKVCSLLVKGLHLPRKSRFKAGLLSAVIPGMGKLYTGRKVDALFAFLQVGSSAWQSYRGFERKGSGSAQGWIFGILAGGLYLGNIYGSVVSVNIYNNKVSNRYFHEFETKIELTLP